jgi:hypothetical protein
MKLRVLDPWVTNWFVFQDRCLRWAETEALLGESRNLIRLEEILMVETDVSIYCSYLVDAIMLQYLQTKHNNTMMQLVTTERKYFFRAKSTDMVRDWVFAFQRAATLDHIAATNARLNAAAHPHSAERPPRMKHKFSSGYDPRPHISSSVTNSSDYLSRHPAEGQPIR